MNNRSKRIINILLVVLMLVSNFINSTYAADFMFDDSEGHWAEEAINSLAEKGIIHGYPDGLSHPDDIITRGEFSAIVARAMKLEQEDTKTINTVFEDIVGHFAQKEINELVDAGIILEKDYGKKYFPDEPITRMEIIKMLVRAIVKVEHDKNCLCDTGFLDDDLLTKEEREYICDGKNYNIISGYQDGTIRPYGKSTRAEAFVMIYNQEGVKDKIEKEELIDSSSRSVPAPEFTFTLPQTAYVGEEIKIKPFSRYVKTVVWTVSQNGVQVEPFSVLEGELKADGGFIKIKSIGSYTFTATAINIRGKQVKHQQTISIYPVVSAKFNLPETAHTDTSVAVDLYTENLGGNSVAWSLKEDDKEIEIETALTGELTSSGGIVQFKANGVYELTAIIKDELGKVITASDTITIYPVAEVKMEIAEITHTDNPIILKTETKKADDIETQWSLLRNGEAVNINDFIEGNISVGDSNIFFKEKGVYNLTASVTDKTGRAFTDNVSITVYPVGSAGFYLPEIFHTDDTVKVEAAFKEIGSQTAEWSLIKNGNKVTLSDFLIGKLSNDGGSVRFTHKGEYILKVSFTDGGGRTYTYEQAFKVYPVPIISYTTPEYAHTDSDIAVKVNSIEPNDLTIEWLIDNTFGFQDWSTYVDNNLKNDGGTIRFKRAGIYELVARVTDETGRVFLFEAGGKTEVFPVLNIGFELPNLAYTDSIIDLRTHGNNNVLPIEWSITKDSEPISLSNAISGNLNAHGGKVTFIEDGNYVLTATMTDYLKRSYSHSQEITVKPVVQYNFTMPESIHYGTEFELKTTSLNIGENKVKWTLEKLGEVSVFDGKLTNNGGKISIRDTGEFVLIATITDNAGRVFTYNDKITVTNTAPIVTLTTTPTRTVKDGKFLVNVNATATDADGDPTTLEYEGTTADSYYGVGTHTIRVRAKDEAGDYSPWVERNFIIENSAPTVTITATPTRTVKDGKFLVDVKTTATDADGDPTTLEYEGTTADSYYGVGTHTIRVRAKDEAGDYSSWIEKSFTILNSVPTAPVISRTPSGNSVAPGTKVTITAKSIDADSDPITYIWEGRNAETQEYSLGKNVVRVKAVDVAGAESPWAAIVFFVADSNGSGGMTLTGPDSVILENGLDGATITEYTFTVPPVSGHSGSDYGRVKGYNILTKNWDQLDYGTTNNGITFSKNLSSGIYSKLEFYYYTNHTCMYNKSNITYSVNYHFE
ncbi:S-layer homology domain-containing protein [Sedimentibacter saalensis]|uniref:S-layer homology domain-containing protein n=1 Tax=Sedimentibacter saalensis TaxID=130788 RepID=UPI00396A465F